MAESPVEIHDLGQSVIDRFDDISRRIDEAQTQVQRLQGSGGLLEPLSNVVGYDQVAGDAADPTLNLLGVEQSTFIGQAQLLLAGVGIKFTQPDNTPFLRISAVDLQCYDYVVDSTGAGTHLLLFGTTGALEAAIATAGDRNILVCSTHVESLAASHSLTNLATDQRIIVRSMGDHRPVFTVASGMSTTPFIKHITASSHVSSHLRFEGLSFQRSSSGGASAGPFLAGPGGFRLPDFELFNVTFDGDRWTYLLDANASITVGDFTFDHVTVTGVITAILTTSSSAATVGRFIIRHSEFASIANIQKRSNSTDLDLGVDGMIIQDNIFHVVTGYGWHRSYNYPFVFTNNHVLNFSGANSFLSIGTSASTSPVDATVDGNYIRCSNTSASTRAITITGGAGTAKNISVVGNSLRGPGGANAHIAVEINIANNDCVIVNSYRDWDTNVGGTSDPGTGTFTGDHGSLLGLTDDDHTAYIRHNVGRSTPNIVIGGTGSGADLTFKSTSNGTLGSIFMGGTTFEYDEVTKQLKLTEGGVSAGLMLGTDAHIYRGSTKQINMAVVLRVENSTDKRYRADLFADSDGMSYTIYDDTAGSYLGLDVYLAGQFTIWRGGTVVDLFIVDEATGQIQVPVVGSGAGILLGGDAQLYRSDADVLRTPDALIVDGLLTASLGVNITNGVLKVGVDDTTLGTIHVYGASGGTVGGTIQIYADADHDTAGDYWDIKAREDDLAFGGLGGANVLMLTHEGQIQMATAGSAAGILMGATVHMYRGAINLLTLGADDAFNMLGGTGDFGAPANATLWYNTSTNKLRVYENGAWVNAVQVVGDFDHGGLTGRSDDDHTQYAILAGRSGGQTLIGDTASGGNLLLQSTSHGTRGIINTVDTLRCTGPVVEAAQGIDRIDLGVQAGTPRMVFENSGHTIWQIDNSNGKFRFFKPGVVMMTLVDNGALQLPLATGPNKGLILGGDTELYRSSANVLRTLDALIVDQLLTAQNGITLTTGVVDFSAATSFEIPNADAPTAPDAAGKIVLDTLVTGWKGGQLQIFGAQELMMVPMVATAHVTTTDGHVIAYNDTNDEFEMVAIDHDALLNFVANEHLLPAAIDHDALLNFVAAEHITQASIDHGTIAGLADDDHAQYALLAGRSTGQTLIGDTATGGDLTLKGTSHGDNNGQILIPNATAVGKGLLIGGDAELYRSGASILSTPGGMSFGSAVHVAIGGTAQITLDGTDGVISSGTVGIMEFGGAIIMQARGNAYIVIDADNNATNNFFSVVTNAIVGGGATTILSMVDEGQLRLPITGSGAGLVIGVNAQWYQDGDNVMRTPDALVVDGALTASGGINEAAVTAHEAAIDHDALNNFVANEHLLTAAIDHDALNNFVANEHLLPAAIDHDGLLNFVAGEHKLDAAIDHDALTNFDANEHLLTAAIVHDSLSGGTSTSAHHVKYTDLDAIGAVEGEATLGLTGILAVDGVSLLGGAVSALAGLTAVVFFVLPHGAAPTVDAVGKIALDTTITDHTPLLRYHSGTEGMLVIAIPDDQLSADDGKVITYHAGDNEFKMATPDAAVTLAGTPDYLTISGQVITRNAIDLTTDVTNDLPIADGGTGAGTAQAAIDALTAVSGATEDHVLTKDSGGNATFQIAGAKSIWLSAEVGTVPTTNGTTRNQLENSTSKINHSQLDFLKDVTSRHQWQFRLPPDYHGGTLSVVFYWGAGPNGGNVMWGCAGRAFADSDSFDLTLGTLVQALDNHPTNRDLHIAPALVITLASVTSPAAGHMVIIEAEREGGHAGDGMGNTAFLFGIEVQYT